MVLPKPSGLGVVLRADHAYRDLPVSPISAGWAAVGASVGTILASMAGAQASAVGWTSRI